uniref:DUF7515 domain-containing protein n=1 Tax=Ditylenchus dipsaci TaxID=166011 RepID=A0A915DG82_9BILA
MEKKNTVGDQLQSLYQTITSKARGYCGTEELLRDFYDDYRIDGQVLAREAGFASFKELLGSKQMQNKIQSEVNYLGQTVYKGRDDPRIRHIRSEHNKSVRNQDAKESRDSRQHLGMAQMNNAQPRVVSSNQTSHGRNSPFFGFDDKEDDGYGPAQSTSTGIIHENSGNHYKKPSNPPLSVKKPENMWEFDDDEESEEPVKHSQGIVRDKTAKLYEKSANPSGNFKNNQSMWELDDEDDKPAMHASQFQRSSESMGTKAKQNEKSIQFTQRGEGVFTDSSVSDDEGDNAAVLPSVSKESEKVNKSKQSIEQVSNLSCLKEHQPFRIEPEIASSRNPFNVFDQPSVPKVAKAAATPHGLKWIEAAAALRQESTAKESRKEKFETSSFTEYQRPSQIEKNYQLSENKSRDTYVDQDHETDHNFKPIPSVVPPSAEALSSIGRDVEYPMKRSESVASITSNTVARRVSKALTEEDLGKIGEVVKAIVKYTYPRAVLLGDLMLAMDLIEPRFSRLEQSTDLSYNKFFERWCEEIIVVGKTGKQNLLWHER